MNVKRYLYDKLLKTNSFWSYDKSSVSMNSLSDDFFIEKVLLHLDIDDVLRLFSIYPEKKIKQVWQKHICILEPYYHDINNLYAVSLFGLKKPELYIKNCYKTHLKRIEKQYDKRFV